MMFYSFHCTCHNSFVIFNSCLFFLMLLQMEVFLFLDCSLPCVYRNTVNFCKLILYPTAFLNSSLTLNSLFCGFLKLFFIYHLQREKVLLLSNLDTFYLFFISNFRGQNLQYIVEQKWRKDVLVLFLLLVVKFSVFLH